MAFRHLFEHYSPTNGCSSSQTEQPLDEAGKPATGDTGAPITGTVGKYCLHPLRHACASLWIESGLQSEANSAIGGVQSGSPLTCTAISSPMRMQISEQPKACGHAFSAANMSSHKKQHYVPRCLLKTLYPEFRGKSDQSVQYCCEQICTESSG
jgi:hypothetical protein